MDARVLGSADGESNTTAGVTDRFMIDSSAAGGRFALVEHRFAPRALAAPMHRHEREDEFTYVLSGRIGAVLGGAEVFGGPGDLIVKPRGQWHTFWNAGDEPAIALEIISPGGLEELFREFASFTDYPEPSILAAMARRFGCDLDFDATGAVIERHRLVF